MLQRPPGPVRTALATSMDHIWQVLLPAILKGSALVTAVVRTGPCSLQVVLLSSNSPPHREVSLHMKRPDSVLHRTRHPAQATKILAPCASLHPAFRD